MADDSSAEPAPYQSAANDNEFQSTQSEVPSAYREIGGKDDAEDSANLGDAMAKEQHQMGPDEDTAAVLKSLGATMRNQDDLEQDIGRQADQLLREQADERDQKRLDKALGQKEKLDAQVRKLQQRLDPPSGSGSSTRVRAEIAHLQPQIDALDEDIKQIQARMVERQREEEESSKPAENFRNKRLPGETKREFLIRTGKITPFSRVGQQTHSSDLADVMLDAEDHDGQENNDFDDIEEVSTTQFQPVSHRILLGPGYKSVESSEAESGPESAHDRPKKKRRLQQGNGLKDLESSAASKDVSEEEYTPEDEAEPQEQASDSESDGFKVVAQGSDMPPAKGKKRRSRAKRSTDDESDAITEDMAGVDDGNESLYQSRLRRWAEGRSEARRKAQAKMTAQTTLDEGVSVTPAVPDLGSSDIADECFLPHPTRQDADLAGGLRIPGDIFPSLFDYQKTGVQWLWELYCQSAGGIIADEMGLGKTIQVIAFLAGLQYSKQLKRPIIIVCPATVMKQWVNEFHRWWPPLRVSILHSSGSGMLNVGREDRAETRLESEHWGKSASRAGASTRTARKIVERVVKEGHVLVTTYTGLQSYAELLIPVTWGYAVLDEGHKIKNPNACITIYCKELKTANRMILSGTPMQNDLTELWSLFDFVFPMRLGNLVNFRTQFDIPIKQGGYANASNLQVETALKCAETLKDAISPYLLQRLKVDVASDLPAKAEEVLFCRLTRTQRELYEQFLGSEELRSIMEGKRNALYGIDILRKICNHPDLPDHKLLPSKKGYVYGAGNKSGKMQVVKALLEMWRDEGHKALLFTQSRIMLDILEKYIQSLGGFKFCRMDGTTNIKDRQSLVDEFNRNPELHVFLLTTKVGGLGVNLTGANRVIIYDPDWNPSTDVQARERAWRLGQTKEVQIYRLMTAGTIEEKIYHRQIFKQHLTNKILRDPKQRQTFQLKDLHDLFSLGDVDGDRTETSSLFQGTEVSHATDSNRQNLPTPPGDQGETARLDGVYGIARREAYQDDEENNPDNTLTEQASADESGTPTNPNSSSSNSRLLSTIFARSGVHSRLEHDAILHGSSAARSGAVTADPEIIAREAKKVASAAARELQRAGEAARAVEPGTVTWTGTFGVGGAPEEPARGNSSNAARGGRGGRGGLASSSVLANLSARQQNAPQQPRGKDFMVLIRDFLLAHDGAVHTQMLIDHFNRYCGTPERTAEFKEMLRTIAVLDRGEGPGADTNVRMTGRPRTAAQRAAMQARAARRGRAKWVLKREFGGTAE